MKMLELLIINADKLNQQLANNKIEYSFFQEGMLVINSNSHSQYYVQIGKTKWFRRALFY